MSRWKRVAYHEYGRMPKGWKPGMRPAFLPYHVGIDQEGNVFYRDPENPYGAVAPHVADGNNDTLGMALLDKVGAQPSEKFLTAAAIERQKMLDEIGGPAEEGGHGELHHKYYNAKTGKGRRFTKTDRSDIEGQWYKTLQEGNYGGPEADPTATAGISGPIHRSDEKPGAFDLASRSITAGHPAATESAPQLVSGPSPAARPSTPPVLQAAFGRATPSLAPSTAIADAGGNKTFASVLGGFGNAAAGLMGGGGGGGEKMEAPEHPDLAGQMDAERDAIIKLMIERRKERMMG